MKKTVSTVSSGGFRLPMTGREVLQEDRLVQSTSGMRLEHPKIVNRFKETEGTIRTTYRIPDTHAIGFGMGGGEGLKIMASLIPEGEQPVLVLDSGYFSQKAKEIAGEKHLYEDIPVDKNFLETKQKLIEEIKSGKYKAILIAENSTTDGIDVKSIIQEILNNNSHDTKVFVDAISAPIIGRDFSESTDKLPHFYFWGNIKDPALEDKGTIILARKDIYTPYNSDAVAQNADSRPGAEMITRIGYRTDQILPKFKEIIKKNRDLVMEIILEFFEKERYSYINRPLGTDYLSSSTPIIVSPVEIEMAQWLDFMLNEYNVHIGPGIYKYSNKFNTQIRLGLYGGLLCHTKAPKIIKNILTEFEKRVQQQVLTKK